MDGADALCKEFEARGIRVLDHFANIVSGGQAPRSSATAAIKEFYTHPKDTCVSHEFIESGPNSRRSAFAKCLLNEELNGADAKLRKIMDPSISLNGRRALVAGGGRGLGRSLALALARHGADVAVASRTQRELKDVVSEIEALGRRGVAVVVDLMKREEIPRAVDTAAEKLGSLEILINNAGGFVTGRTQIEPLEHDEIGGFVTALQFDPMAIDDRSFEDTVFFNLTQVYYTSKAAIAHMVKQKWGRIVNIGSGAARFGYPIIPYTAAKHGLVGLTRSMAYAGAHHGINVNLINPGAVSTPTLEAHWKAQAARNDTTVEALRQYWASQAVLNRIVQPDEFGPMAVLLCSDAAGAITGQVINVDAGLRI